ncbi:hypothetical protein BDN67DRAFT_972221, partial [Paxillus ammoniavirescens]
GLQLKLLIADIPPPCMRLFEGVGDRSIECGRYGKCTVGVVDYWCYDTNPFDPFAEWKKVSTTELLFVRADVEVKGNLSMICL